MGEGGHRTSKNTGIPEDKVVVKSILGRVNVFSGNITWQLFPQKSHQFLGTEMK